MNLFLAIVEEMRNLLHCDAIVRPAQYRNDRIPGLIRHALSAMFEAIERKAANVNEEYASGAMT